MGTVVVIARCGNSSLRHIPARLRRDEANFKMLTMLTSREKSEADGPEFEDELIYGQADEIRKLSLKEALILKFRMNEHQYGITTESVEDVVASKKNGLVIMPEEQALWLSKAMEKMPRYEGKHLYVHFGPRSRNGCEDLTDEDGTERRRIQLRQESFHKDLIRLIQALF